MKKIFLFIAISLSVVANCQTWNTTNTASRYTRSNFLGVLSSDSGLILGNVSSLAYCHLNNTFGSLVTFGDSLYFRSVSSWINLSRISGTSANAFVKGGNSFGTDAVLGTNDNNPLKFRTFGTNWISLGQGGDLVSNYWSLNQDGTAGWGDDGSGNPTTQIYSNSLLLNNGNYINFGKNSANKGSIGFGFRDSSGLVMFKDSLGSWKRFASAGGGSDTSYFKLNYDNSATGSNAYTGFNSFSYGKLGIRGTSLGKGVFNYDDGGGVGTDQIYVDNSFSDTIAYKSYVRSYVDSNTPALTLQDVTYNGNTTTDSIIAASFKITGGTSSQFLKANGSVDNNTYLTTAVTSVATGLGLSGGAITTSGTLIVDTASTSIISRQRAAATYEPTIALNGTTKKYWTGYKTWASMNSDSLTEGSTNLFYTNARARTAISLTTTGTSGAATYNSSTGVFNVPNYAGTSYTFSTGLTNTSGTVTNNLSTGISGGQTANGGTGSSDNLTINSTTNATKGDIYLNPLAAGNTNTNGGVFVGAATADPLPISGDPKHLFGIINDNSNKQMFSMWAIGSSVYQNNMHFYRANGTIAIPTAITASQMILSMGFRGYDGTAMSQSAAAYQVVAPSNWTTSNHEARFQWEVTPNASTSRARAMQLNGNGSLWLTNNSSLTPYRTTTQFVLDGVGYSGDFRGLIQSTSSNGAGLIFGESTSSESYLIRYGSSYSSNYIGTSLPIAASFNFRSGGSANQTAVVSGTPIVNLVGTTSTNFGTRLDAAGLRIDQIQNLHTSNVASAALEIVSTTKGVLMPRMTTAQMNAISSPATGLELYNTDSKMNVAYNGSAYKSVGVLSGSFSGTGTATTTFTVTFGGTQPNSTYKVNVTPTSSLSAALFYVTNKTTTTFDVMYLAGLTGTVTFDYSLTQ